MVETVQKGHGGIESGRKISRIELVDLKVMGTSQVQKGHGGTKSLIKIGRIKTGRTKLGTIKIEWNKKK